MQNKKKSMRGTTIRFPDPLRSEIERTAKRESRTFGQQVRAIVEDWFRKRREVA